MTISEIKALLHLPEYNFLRENKYLGKRIILLGMGGSYSYGTNTEQSDVDIRGIATNSKANILTGTDFEQVVNVATDTTVYSLEKMIKLLCSCNPNVIELLGLKDEHYLYMTPAGQLLLDNKMMFLSRQAVYTFGGYADAQLRRLENKATRTATQTQNEQNILKSIGHAEVDFKQKYFPYSEDNIKLYIDKSEQEEYDSEIFMDINLKHYPLRDYCSMWNEMQSIVRSYNKLGKRNEKAIEANKLGKHMMHLLRLYYMCFDILEKGEIITYREKEHDLLMSVRNGDYLDKNGQPVAEFYDIVNDFEKRLEYDKENTSLPDKVDMAKVKDIVMNINEQVVKGEGL